MDSISACLIARNAEATIRDTLECLKGNVDEIIVVMAGLSTDKTAEIAKEYATVYEDYPGELFEDGSIMSFAEARMYSFSKAKGDWLLWLDADDTLDNPERLKLIAEAAGKQGLGGVWFPYFYAFDDHGNCSTLIERERLLRADLGWKWVGRIHEAAVPNKIAAYMKSAEVIYRHRHNVGTPRGERNLRLLYLQLKEEPGNQRLLFYLGNQYFALEQWDEAIKWWDKFTDVAENIFEKWQAFVYKGKTYAKLGKLKQAKNANLLAMDLIPEWADPYFGMAEAASYQSDWQRVIFWTNLGRERDMAKGYIMVNPLDYTVNPTLFEEVAYCQMGYVETALEKVKEGLEVIPEHKHLLFKKELYEGTLDEARRAEGLLQYLDSVTPEEAGRLSSGVPVQVMKFPEVQERIGTIRFNRRPRKEPKIVFYCGMGAEEWSPPKVAKGMGGSETAVVEIAKRLAKDGWHVDVYGKPGDDVGLHEGVGYWYYQTKPDTTYDVLVSWRNPFPIPIEAKKKILWMHDLHQGSRITPESIADYDHILGVSKFHRDYLGMVYDFIDKKKLGYVYNGINLELFDQEVERKPHKVVYSSSFDRGLQNLISVWPLIKSMVSDAELHLYYGWNLIDRMIELGDQALLSFKRQMVEAMNQEEGIIYHGRTPKEELARELLSAQCLFYPLDFLEVFFIGGVEAMAAGLGIVAGKYGALPEVIGDAGVLIPNYPRSEEGVKNFVGNYFAMLLEDDLWKDYQQRGRERAKLFTWNRSFEQWKEYL